jgi:MinD-like ATPase involved in chromosome partitioning or flagellar assembly
MSTMNRSLQSLRKFLDNRGEASPWSPNPGVVVVGSGKGGVGTSTVSALLALAGALEDRRILLIDGDEGVGSLNFLLGLNDPGPGLGDLRGGDLEPFDLLHPVSDCLWFLPGGGGSTESTLATALGERRALFRRVSDLFDEFDMVIVDGGSHLASVTAACGTGPERLLALTTPDRVAMASTHALLKIMGARQPSLPIEIVVNLGQGAPAEDTFRMMSQASKRFLGVQPVFAGSFPDDPQLRAHTEAGAPLTTMEVSCPAFDAASLLHSRLAGRQEALDGEGKQAISFPA